MKGKKSLLWLLVIVLVVSVALVACDNEPKVTVTYYDGTQELKTEQIAVGGKATRYEPTKEGYTFVNWFATPSKNHKFDFDTAITEDIGIYAGFSRYQEDTREYYIVGSGSSKLLLTQNWGVGINDTHKLTKVEGKNEYTITLDLMAGDEFQFALNAQWENKRGFGYIENVKLADGTAVFSGQGGGYGTVTSKGQNIKVLLDGNYTMTLKTYPADDTYNTSDPTYTEAGKEVYNMGTYDEIVWVRNGDPVDPVVVVTKYYIKGAGITAWSDMWNDKGELVKQDDGTYKLTTYLKENEEFMIASANVALGEMSAGTKYVRSTDIDEASKALFGETAGKNIIAKAAGTYTFVFNETTGKLSATVDTAATPQPRDYYLDGTFAGSWGDTLYGAAADRVAGSITCTCDPVNQHHVSYNFIDDYKLQETAVGSGIFRLQNVALPAGAELIIQSYVKGSTEPGLWGQDGYNQLGTYNSTYLLKQRKATDNFEAVSATNLNIKVKVAGTYTISFDSYSGVISISEGIDLYIKGSINGWKHDYKDEHRFVRSETDKDLYELTVTFAAGDEFGFAMYDKGSKVEGDNGAFLNISKAGTATDTASFVPEEGTKNYKATVAGTYKIVYNIATDTIDFFKVVA